jgi:hypothetical protein
MSFLALELFSEKPTIFYRKLMNNLSAFHLTQRINVCGKTDRIDPKAFAVLRHVIENPQLTMQPQVLRTSIFELRKMLLPCSPKGAHRT